jgi:hypothetical protein
VKLCAEKSALRPDLKEDDPYDVGIFTMQKTEEKWKLVIECTDYDVQYQSYKEYNKIDLSFKSVQLFDGDELDKPNQSIRFPTLVRSPEGISISVQRYSRECKQHTADMEV